MKKIDFRKQRYVFPLIVLPFLFVGFYLYQDTFSKEKEVALSRDGGLQESISDVSEDVKSRELSDKLGAYQEAYRQADGYTAISGLRREEMDIPRYDDLYSQQEKARLDSLEEAYRASLAKPLQEDGAGYSPRPGNPYGQDSEMAGLLNRTTGSLPDEPETQRDPWELMKEQYALLDSLQKAGDPEYQAELERQEMEEARQRERERRKLNNLTVQRAGLTNTVFNTIKRGPETEHIKAIIDERIAGFAGSRVRIRLLDDIMVGENRIGKGSYLYALITGFTDQRVMLTVTSVSDDGKQLPVNLEVYDMDGLKGLYVPESAFREFTKDLGSSSMQGMNMQGTQGQDQFLMSGLQRMFTSTSQAISKSIRKNKANIKYSTFIYLIDDEELSN